MLRYDEAPVWSASRPIFRAGQNTRPTGDGGDRAETCSKPQTGSPSTRKHRQSHKPDHRNRFACQKASGPNRMAKSKLQPVIKPSCRGLSVAGCAMGNALSMALRVRFRNLMDGGLRAAAAGKMLLLSPATAARWGKQVRDGDPLEPLPSVPRKGSGKPEPFVAFCAELAELIEPDPDIPMVELQAALPAADGVPCSTSGTDALLRRHGYTCKRIHISKGLIAEESPVFSTPLSSSSKKFLGNRHCRHAPSLMKHGPIYSYTEDRTLSRTQQINWVTPPPSAK